MGTKDDTDKPRGPRRMEQTARTAVKVAVSMNVNRYHVQAIVPAPADVTSLSFAHHRSNRHGH